MYGQVASGAVTLKFKLFLEVRRMAGFNHDWIQSLYSPHAAFFICRACMHWSVHARCVVAALPLIRAQPCYGSRCRFACMGTDSWHAVLLEVWAATAARGGSCRSMAPSEFTFRYRHAREQCGGMMCMLQIDRHVTYRIDRAERGNSGTESFRQPRNAWISLGCRY